jgi:hypothetical protein
MGYSTNRPPGWEPPNPEDRPCKHGFTGPCRLCHKDCDRCEGQGFLLNAYCDVPEEIACSEKGEDFNPEWGDSLCPGPLGDAEAEADAKQLWADFMELSALPWRKFTKEDWYAFAGAMHDAQICYQDGRVYVRTVEDGVLCIERHQEEELGDLRNSRVWTFKVY